MRGQSQVSKRPLAKSVNLHPKKSQKCSSKLFACSIHQFQFNLPSYSIPITVRNIYTAPAPELRREENTSALLEDCRKELIKQKIKFRVKQEMWNLIKKNYEKPTPIDPPTTQDSKQLANPEAQVPFVKGASLMRTNRGNITFRKKSDVSQRRLSQSYYKQKQIGEGQKHKRVWSSFVKMKDKDRMEMQKSQCRVSASTFNIEKLDAYKIEPWKGFDDQENLLEDH